MIPKRFHEVFDACVVSFFEEACAMKATSTAVPDIQVTSDSCSVASLGFTSELAKGTLLLVARAESLRASHPMVAMGAAVGDSDLADWSGEITNQVLGRFKNAILPYGLTLNMSVPSVLNGSSLRLATYQKGERILRGVRTESGLVFGMALVVVFEQGFDASSIDSSAAPRSDARKEGGGVLF
jgi:hypothetical protein